MKSAVLAVAAGSLVGSAVAGRMHEAHANFHHRRAALATGYSNGSCTAYTSYVTGAPTCKSRKLSTVRAQHGTLCCRKRKSVLDWRLIEDNADMYFHRDPSASPKLHGGAPHP